MTTREIFLEQKASEPNLPPFLDCKIDINTFDEACIRYTLQGFNLSISGGQGRNSTLRTSLCNTSWGESFFKLSQLEAKGVREMKFKLSQTKLM